jgi:hypothetical protein
MRAVLNGKYKLHEVSEEVSRLIENLEANGVEEIDSINLYFTPLIEGRTMRFYNTHGDEIEILRFKEALPKVFVPKDEGISAESKGSNSPKVTAYRKRQLRGDVPASFSLDPTSEDFLSGIQSSPKKPL